MSVTEVPETVDPPVKPKPAKAKAVAEPTEYVVLRRPEPDTGVWEVGAHTEASSATEAIRRTVSKLGADDQAGTYVAVPARSWRPVTVTAEVQTKLKLESA